MDHHIGIWDKRAPLNSLRQGISSHLVRDLVSDLERFAPLLKHPSFAAEHEWRLVSPLVHESEQPATLIHVPTATTIKQFQVFALLTPQHPVIPEPFEDDGVFVMRSAGSRQGFRPVLGPSPDSSGMEEAIRALAPPEFGWVGNVERTQSPYR